ncbi:Glutathione S-transferase-like ustS-like protein [Cladobotryum mycophilum]|uniref:Glutathione S-transferase-like ustS-like protein n=1 Tax=Cladobotryum mycophilum TaxID=491253 RepID=A0ABR0SMX1_9HYPO
MSAEQIILFDLPSKPPNSSWSLNPWKTRMLLNFKGLDYKTEWLEFPEIRPTLESRVPPNDPGAYKEFTVPTVRLPDGNYVQDSRKIASVIEQKYPDPPVHLDAPCLAKLEALIVPVTLPLRPIMWGRIPDSLLNKPSYDHFFVHRPPVVGMPLDQYEREEGGEKAYAASEPALRQVTELLNENQDGPFFLGNQPSYTDFVWAGFLIFIRRIGEDFYEEVLRRTGDPDAHARLLKAVEPWTKKND